MPTRCRMGPGDELVEEELLRVRETHGNQAIYGGSYGWASAGRLHHSPSLLKRFLGGFGGYVDKLGNHSFGAALAIMPYVVGSNDITGMASDWRAVCEHTRLFVCFGGIHSKNAQIDSGGTGAHCSVNWMRQARHSGVTVRQHQPEPRRIGPGVRRANGSRSGQYATWRSCSVSRTR